MYGGKKLYAFRLGWISGGIFVKAFDRIIDNWIQKYYPVFLACFMGAILIIALLQRA